MKNLQVSKKSIIFAALFGIVVAIAVGCVATNVGLKCDDKGCEFHLDSVQFDKPTYFVK